MVNVYINHEKKFAFVEMRSVEEASNAMALDGIILEVIIIFLLSLDVQFYHLYELKYVLFTSPGGSCKGEKAN